ncbi:hypothetical protein D9M71_391460 [compost metagenome]
MQPDCAEAFQYAVEVVLQNRLEVLAREIVITGCMGGKGVVCIQAKLRKADIGETHPATQAEHLFVFQAEVIEQLCAAVPGAMVLGEEQPVEVVAPHLVVGGADIVGAAAIFGRQVEIARVVRILGLVEIPYSTVFEQLAGILLHAGGGIQVEAAACAEVEAVLQLDHGLAQVVVRLGVFGLQAAAGRQLPGQRVEAQVVDLLAAEVGQLIAPAVLVARAEGVDAAEAQLDGIEAVAEVEAGGGRRQDARGVVAVLGVAADLLAGAEVQLASPASEFPAQVGFHRLGDAVRRLHRVVLFQVADAVGVVADVNVVGQAVAVIDAQHVAVPAGVEAELGRLHPLVAGRTETAAVVFIPVELAVAQRCLAVVEKALGVHSGGQQATSQARQILPLNSHEPTSCYCDLVH